METTAAKLDIGGICVRIQSPHGEILAHVNDRYANFLSDATPEFDFVMAFEQRIDPADFLNVPIGMLQTFMRDLVGKRKTGDGPAHSAPPSGYDRPLPSPSGESRLASRPQFAPAGRKCLFQRSDLAGWIDVEARQGKCVLKKYMENIAIESFLRICYSYLAVINDGLLLHSAGVVRGGNGYIFPGVSGTGKSTIAGLATSREQVLSDELVVVRKKEKDYVVYSTPFFGTNKSAERNSHAPLKAAFLPIKDSRVCLKKARPAPALTRLLSSALFFSREDELNRRLMDISAELVGQVPFYEMYFRRDASFWECIGELEQNGGI
jgi:hypothetical protein